MRLTAFVLLPIALAFVASSAFAAPKKKAVASTPTVVRPTLDFLWDGAGGKVYPLKQLRGQPVVVVIAPSPETKALRAQAEKIAENYLDLSSRKAVFIAAFTAQKGRVESDVPFAIAQNGAQAAAIFGVNANGFGLVVIGPDGNVDMKSDQVVPAQRILDVINNSYTPQAAARKGQDKKPLKPPTPSTATPSAQ